MRYSDLLRLSQRRGFFFGPSLLPYTKTAEKVLPLTFGTSRRAVQTVVLLTEHARLKPGRLDRRYGPLTIRPMLQRALGYFSLQWSHNHISFIVAYARRVLWYIRVGHYKAFRYRLALPVRGQRSHSNAKTVRRGTGAHIMAARRLTRTSLFWWARAKPALRKKQSSSKQTKSKGPKSTKSAKGGTKPKKKKLDVWR